MSLKTNVVTYGSANTVWGPSYPMDAHIILFVLQEHSSYHTCMRNGKCYLMDTHIIYCGNIVSGWYNGHHSCMQNGKCYLMDAHTIYCGDIVSGWHNGHHSCVRNEKWSQTIPISYDAPQTPLPLHNLDYHWIHTEKWCIKPIHMSKMCKLPNMVSLIVK